MLNSPHYVYYMVAGNEIVKVGFSNHVEERLQNVEREVGLQFVVGGTRRFSNRAQAEKFESFVHSALKSFQIVGEYFDYPAAKPEICRLFHADMLALESLLPGTVTMPTPACDK